MNDIYLGIDIGGTKCAAVIGSTIHGEIHILDKTSFPTQTELGADRTIKNILATVDAVLKKNGLAANDLSAIGISCGGPLDSRTGHILSPPNLYGWDDVPITQIFKERYGVRVSLQNDANACALAEWKFGAAKGLRNVLFLTCGTGLGAGLILNGSLYEGTTGMAGEVGHIRLSDHGPVGYGKEGSFEGFCSGGGIAQVARTKAIEKLQVGEYPAYCEKYSDLDGITAKTVAEAANRGDQTAVSVYDLCAGYLGKGISVLIDILNPEMVVIGSIYARSESLFREKVLEAVQREALGSSARCCKIVPASFGDRIGDIAALSVAASGHAAEQADL